MKATVLAALLATAAPASQAVDFASFGVPCGGDAGPALDAAMWVIERGTDKTLDVTGCSWVLHTQPRPLPPGMLIRGQGESFSGFECRFRDGTCFNLGYQGAALHRLFVWVRKGYPGNVGVLIQPKTGQPGGSGYNTLRDVVITSPDGGDWLVPLYVDGSGNYNNGSQWGARAVQLDNVRAFGGSYACAILWSAPDLQWLTGNCYKGSGHGALRGGYGKESMQIAPWIQQ